MHVLIWALSQNNSDGESKVVDNSLHRRSFRSITYIFSMLTFGRCFGRMSIIVSNVCTKISHWLFLYLTAIIPNIYELQPTTPRPCFNAEGDVRCGMLKDIFGCIGEHTQYFIKYCYKLCYCWLTGERSCKMLKNEIHEWTLWREYLLSNWLHSVTE